MSDKMSIYYLQHNNANQGLKIELGISVDRV